MSVAASSSISSLMPSLAGAIASEGMQVISSHRQACPVPRAVTVHAEWTEQALVAHVEQDLRKPCGSPVLVLARSTEMKEKLAVCP